MSPYVDVQHPEQGEFTRYFSSQDDAERYVEHMKRDRGYLAEIRKEVPAPHHITQKEKERWQRIQQIRKIAGGK